MIYFFSVHYVLGYSMGGFLSILKLNWNKKAGQANQNA